MALSAYERVFSMPIKSAKTNQFEIFRAGTRTSSDGRTFHFSSKDLDEIASNYDPKVFRAPLILSHNTFGKSDRDLAQSELAFGVVEKVVREGDNLHCYCNPIAPEISNWVKEGRILDRSASFYPPDSPNNPTPGKWSLRHVALLGRTPPAVKGMSALSLSEFDFAEDDDSVEFGAMKVSTSKIASMFGGIRDFLIEFVGLEAANRILPREALSGLVEVGNWGDMEDGRAMTRLHERLDEVEQELVRTQTAKLENDFLYEEQKMTDYYSELESLRAEVARQRIERRRDRIAMFQERYSDRLTPAMLEEITVSFGEESRPESLVSFCEGLSEGQFNYFEQFLSRIPKQVEFGELTANPGPSRYASPPANGAIYEPNSLALDRKIRAYQQEHPNLSYAEVLGLPEFSELYEVM